MLSALPVLRQGAALALVGRHGAHSLTTGSTDCLLKWLRHSSSVSTSDRQARDGKDGESAAGTSGPAIASGAMVPPSSDRARSASKATPSLSSSLESLCPTQSHTKPGSSADFQRSVVTQDINGMLVTLNISAGACLHACMADATDGNRSGMKRIMKLSNYL